MNPGRTHRSPIRPHRTEPSRAGRFRATLLALALLVVPGPARAVVQGGETVPREPTVCDPVTLAVSGYVPDDCHTVRMRVSDPELLPTGGPIPTYRIRVRVIVEDQNPILGRACVLVIQPYKLAAPLGRLPFGTYWVEATEYDYPYPADATSPVDSSHVSFSFDVAPKEPCDVADGCVLLGFAPSGPLATSIDHCTAHTGAGGRACFEVTLQNPMPVGALQTEIVVAQPYRDANVIDLFTPIEVKAAPRAAGFEAAWTAVGSTAKIVLYSASGAAIAAGRGPVLHVCYAVGTGTPDGAYPIHFRNELVATPGGEAIPQCPTFARIEGRICVGDRATCDLNGDGIGDVRDVLRLVRCILAGTDGSSACPDSIRARADCNEDGLLDVRDLLCCIRRILANDAGWGEAPSTGDEPAGTPARIGFDGDAVWTTPYEGVATVTIEPGEEFGGMQWIVDPGSAARVRDVVLDDPGGPYAVSWAADAGGAARILFYDRGAVEGGAASGGVAGGAAASVRILLDPAAGAPAGGELTLRGWRSASWDASPVVTQAGATHAALPANAAADVPAILSARPNPFVASTEIVYSLPAPGPVSLRLYDVSGRLVRTLVSGRMEAGVHRASWDGRDERGRETGSGVYFVRFDAAGVTTNQRLLRLR